MWQEWRPPELLALVARQAFDRSLIWATVGLAGLLLLGALAITLTKRWRMRNEQGDDALNYQKLLDQGLLSAEELERIRSGDKNKGSTVAAPPAEVPKGLPPSPNEASAANGPARGAEGD